MSKSFLDKLLGRPDKAADSKITCLFSTGMNSVDDGFDIELKENRADKVDYRAIGQTKYGSGQPPQIYDSSLSAIKRFPLVYGCITAISDAIAALDVKVYEVDGGERTEVTDHPFYLLFSRPNPFQGSFEFLEEMSQQLDTFGNVFITKEKVGGEYELYLLNPKYVAIIPDPKVKVKEYRYYINGQVAKYKPEEIIHLKYTDLDDPYFGQPPLNVASNILNFEDNRLAFANQFFINGAIPAGVLETDQNLGDSLLKKLRGEWSGLHRGVTNSHKVAILQGGLKYRAIASPLKDLNFEGLKRLTKEDILTIYKIPESILGSQEGTGSKEGKDALTTFWRSCIVPRLRRVEAALNRGLAVEMFGEGTTAFEFNLKEVVALQEDKREQADYLEKMVGCSVMTPNEARAVLGLPKMTGDQYADSLLVSNSFFGNSLMPLDAALAGVGGAGSNEEKPSSKPAATATPAAKPATKPKK